MTIYNIGSVSRLQKNQGEAEAMNAPEPSITFRELFTYDNYLAKRWLEYFRQYPAALDIDIGGKTGTVRELVLHIFQVQQVFADRVWGKESVGKKLENSTLDQLAELNRESLAQLTDYASSASEVELRKVQAFGSFTPSNRKMLAQAALHSIHHWAQIAMEVRQAGLPTQQPQDIILSDVME